MYSIFQNLLIKLLKGVVSDSETLGCDLTMSNKFKKSQGSNEGNMAAVKFVPLERSVVWAKVGRDPWWPSVVLAAGGGGGGKAWRRKKGGKEEFRCVFLQAGETFQWLQVKNLRPFSNEDTGIGKPQEYVVTQPKYQEQHLLAIHLGVRSLDGGSLG